LLGAIWQMEFGRGGSMERPKSKMIEAMVQVVDGTIDLPRAVVTWIGTAHELGLFLEGDTLILKKMQPARLSDIALRVLEDEMPKDENVAEVQQHRREGER
jgi:hypothetical protein